MQKLPSVDYHPHVDRDPDDSEHDDIAGRRARPLDPFRPLVFIEARDRVAVARVAVLVDEGRQLDPELLVVDQADQAPAVEADRIAPAILKWNPDVMIRPPGFEHQKRSGNR